MSVHPSTRQHLHDHLGQAEFSLNVTKYFACLPGTAAEGHVKAALAEVALARAWVRNDLKTDWAAPRREEPVQETLPLTRKERLSFRHVVSP